MQAAPEESAHETDQDWSAFSKLDRLTNHWDRPGWWPGRRGYYWYLTFDQVTELRDMASRCQAALDAPYFNLVSLQDLHMTLERVAFEGEITPTELQAVERAAADACANIPPFTINIGPLAGSSGAISFSASPRAKLENLRKLLDDATKEAFTAKGPPESLSFRPHVGVAYCNATLPASMIIEVVRKLRSLPPVAVDVRSASLVELAREENAYNWSERQRLFLGG